MTMKLNSDSKTSIEDFRDRVAQGLGPAGGVLINLIDVLAIGPRPAVVDPNNWTVFGVHYSRTRHVTLERM
jgi:hypothetical protein